MNTTQNNKHKLVWYFAVVILLISFSIIACYSDWDKDEAWSYLNVSSSSFYELFQYAKFKYANNQLLNSFWFRFLFDHGVKRVFLYRLPSILLFLVYAWFINKLFSTEKNARYELYVKLAFLLLPFAEYFTLGRGYAFAITAFTGSFYYFKLALENPKNGSILKFILLGCLSSIAIFSFIFPLLAILVYYFLFLLKEKKLSFVKLLLFAIEIPFLYYVYTKGKFVNEYDDSITGTNSLFQKDFIVPFIGVFTYYKYLGSVYLFKLFINAFLSLTICYTLFVMIRHKLYFTKELGLIIIIFAILIVSNVIFKSKYPTERALMFLIFLAYAMLASLLYTTGDKIMKIQFLIIIFIGLSSIVSITKHALSFNTLAAMKLFAKPDSKLVIADYVPDPNVYLYNQMFFNDKVTIVRSDWNDSLLATRLSDADYVFTGALQYRKDPDKFNANFVLQQYFIHDYRNFVMLKRK